jgi:uncharacterized membrane protein (DUF485 family)
MAEPLAPRGEAHAAHTSDRPHPEIDWEAIERSHEFQQLVHRRRRFVIPCTIFFLAWYMGFILLTAYAQGFMGERIYQGLTVGYCLALTQFLMVLGLGLWYLRKADSDFDPLAEKAIEAYVDYDVHPGERRPDAPDAHTEEVRR